MATTKPSYVPAQVEFATRNKLMILQSYEVMQELLEELASKMSWTYEKSEVTMKSQRPHGYGANRIWLKYVFDDLLVVRLLKSTPAYEDGADECDEIFRHQTVVVLEAAKEPNEGWMLICKMTNTIIGFTTSIKPVDDYTLEEEADVEAEAEPEAKEASSTPLGKKRRFN